MTVFRLLFLSLLLAVTAGRTAAQRCLPGMKGVRLSADMVDGFYSPAGNDGMGYAFSLAFFNYVKNGNKWEYGVEYVRRICRYRTIGVPMEQYTADAGYFLNLLSSTGKVFFLNAGLSVTTLPQRQGCAGAPCGAVLRECSIAFTAFH